MPGSGKRLSAEHGVIAAYPRDYFGYFGWPSVARTDGGTLVAVASGLRAHHVCPHGRTIICTSADEGATWTSPRVVNDSPLDDRDAGVVSLGGERLLIAWFSSDHRERTWHEKLEALDRARYEQGLRWVTDANAARGCGSWVRASDDGGETWRPPVKVPVSAPHGPVRLGSGDLLYLGKVFGETMADHTSGARDVKAMRSSDDGLTWTEEGAVPLCEGTAPANYHEPHFVELPSGKIVGLIRVQNHSSSPDLPRLEDVGIVHFSLMQTESEDGGKTWSRARPLGFHGSPPHVIRHSSGALVCAYGFRQEPYGERVAVSRDDGASWEHDWVLRDDGPDGDLGYPASVELPDGSIFTLYYQKPESSADKCGLLWSRWRLPGV